MDACQANTSTADAAALRCRRQLKRYRWTGWSESDVKRRCEEPDKNETKMDAPPDTPARARPADAFDTLPALSYWLPHNHEPAAHWTHEAYRNASGNGVTIHYCTDRITSERIAKQFLACPVVGFDMEWAVWGAKGLKGNISLIQVASEDTIV